MHFDRHIPSGDHVVHLSVEQSNPGWDVREQLDTITVHLEHHNDWHHVERAMTRLEIEVLHHGIVPLAAH